MKKKFFKMLGVLFLVLGASACSDPIEDIHLPLGEEPQETTPISAIISPEEAEVKAEGAYSLFNGKQLPESRATEIEVFAVAKPNSRSESSDTVAYLVNFPQDGGYTLIAAAREAETDILAFIPKGHLESIEDIVVPAQKAYVLTLIENIKQRKDIPLSRADLKPITEEKYVNDTVSDVRGTISGLFWGQSGYFGKYCDNGICGCFPLATALIAAHFEEPKQMNIGFVNDKTPSVSKTISIDWKDIKKYKGAGAILVWDFPSSTALDNIGLICRQIGKIADTKYYANGNSSTNRSNDVNALKQIFPTRQVSKITDYDMPYVASALKKGPVLMLGSSSENDGGHAWVAEQYKFMQIKSDYYTREYMHVYWTYVSTSYRTYYDMYFNWGWNGEGNGFYDCRYATSFSPDGVTDTYSKLKYITVQ